MPNNKPLGIVIPSGLLLDVMLSRDEGVGLHESVNSRVESHSLRFGDLRPTSVVVVDVIHFHLPGVA